MNNSIKYQYILSLILGLFLVIFLWGFFQKGVFVLGINTTIFGFGFFILFLLGIPNKIDFLKKNIYWIIPYFIIILSYSIYEIPFLKGINLWLLPLITLFFFGLSISKLPQNHEWDIKIIKKLIFRKLNIRQNINQITENIKSGDNKKQVLYKKIASGVGIFIIINVIIISLLMSADNNFRNFIGNIGEIISLSNIFKGGIAIILTIVFISFSILWRKKNIIESKKINKEIDSIIGGIVLGGTLFTYILFIGVQIDTLFNTNISETVQKIASLVKTGFWQLFFISIINIIFFFIYYKKTNKIIQKILGVFIFASVIILASAAHKMFMYTSIYGLSYEKFFASYTILYFGILFVSMIVFIILNHKQDILKISCLLALWMYGTIHILPTEVFIFTVNTNILQQENAKIQKYQSHMLSIDILPNVITHKGSKIYTEESWQKWVDKKLNKSNNKNWYEKNLMDYLSKEKTKKYIPVNMNNN